MLELSLIEYDALLTLIYDSALAPERWPAALRALAIWLDAPKALLFTPEVVPAQGGFYYPYGLTAHDMALWATQYQPKDFWLERLLERGLFYEGSVVIDRDLHNEVELLESPWYREFLSQLDIARLATAAILTSPRAGQLSGANSSAVVSCALFRSLDAPAFDADTRRKLGLVLPHLSRALSVMFRLRDAEHRIATSENALHALHNGVLLFDASGQVVFMNRAAEQLMKRGSGFGVVQNRLQVDDPQVQHEWQRALRASLMPQARVAHFAESLLLTHSGNPLACMLQLSRLPENSQFGLPAGAARVIAFISEADQVPQIDIGLLTRTWGLSRAEARTAAAMCKGGRVHDIAVRLGLSSNTLKTQLKQVYQKTGCTSRSDLTRLMLSLRSDAMSQATMSE